MPAIGAVAAIWGAIGGVTVGTVAVGAMLQSMIISYALSAIVQALGSKERDQAAQDYGAKVNTANNIAPLLVFYGRREVGGNEYRAASGENNKFLHRVLVIGEGEMDAVEAVYLNGKNVDTYTDDEGNLVYADLVEYTFHSGTDGQAADSDLVQAIEDWGPDHRGFGVAYIHLRTEWDRDVFDNGLPTLTVLARGLKILDPRSGLVEWSENPALCLRDYLTNTRYGVGVPESAIDDESFIEAANYCDETVTFTDADGAEFQAPRYTCNGVLNPDDGALENTKRILTTCRGIPVFSGGKWRLVIDKPEVSTFAFDPDNIVGAWSFSGSSKRSIVNQVRAQFIDADRNSEESFTVTSVESYIASDGQIFEQDVFYPLTNSLARANILAQHHLKDARQGLTATFTATLEAFAVNVGDVITITHPTPGWEAKPFRVQKLELEAADKIRVTVSEYDPSVYTFDVLQPPALPDTNLPDPTAAPPPSGLDLHSGTEHLQVAGDGTVISRMLATWAAPPSTFVERYEIGYKLSVSTGWTAYESTEKQHYFAPVAEGYNYDVRVRAIYYSGRRSSWIERANYTIVGKTAPPDAPISFSFASQRDYTREFTWALNTAEPDVAGYKIRYSAAMTDDWGDMVPLHTGLLLASPWETNLLNAGTYRFGIKTIDTTGNESTAAKYMSATLEDSPISSILAAFYPRLEGWPGAITNGYILPSGDIESTDPTTWDDLEAAATTWDNWLSWGLAGDDLTYQYSDIDLGTILTFRPVITAQADGEITYEIDYSTDGVAWSGWQTPAADIDARYLRCRILVTGTAPRIQSVTILLDGKKETEDISDLDTSTLAATYRTVAGDIRLPIAYGFTNIKTVSITLQNTGPGWSWELVDKDTATGPRIKIYDNTSTLADATIDATVKGY